MPSYAHEMKNAYIGEDTGIVCDFTQSDCGFTFAGINDSSHASYGRDSNGFYVSGTSGYNLLAARRTPSSLYTQGEIKKIVLDLYSATGYNGGGICEYQTTYGRWDDYTVRTWRNVVQRGQYNGSYTGQDVAVTNPSNSVYQIIIDLNNSQSYISTQPSSILTIPSNIKSLFETNWGSHGLSICALRGKEYGGSSYIKKATFYFK